MSVESIRNVVSFIVILGVLVFVHEMGHFIIALLARVKIKEFGFGLPPRIRRLTSWRDTEITLNWLPLGGFVRPEGEFDPTIPGGLAASSPWTRLGIFAAGPIANLIIGLCLLVIGFMAGWPDQVKVVDVSTASPAEIAGLQSDDVITQINGYPVHNTTEVRDLIYENRGLPLSFEIDRKGELSTITLTPREVWPEGQGPAGFITSGVVVKYKLPTALRRAVEQMIALVQETTHLTLRIVRGQMTSGEARITGPVGLKQVSDQAVANAIQWNEWFPILYLGAWMSTAIGLTNLLPLPALDGGRALFVGIEIFRGKPISVKVEKAIHAAGVVLLLILFIVLTLNDILHPFA
ncbi:MAG: site-2 protease family protein [Anaerolineaceae bacterium]|nr:MAG: site-2 protease family protein [Anaerolineaceae bacterium]